ncbi:MAG TPA: FHA domain-containing protein, partial [Candidatus Acidoferrum sp.]|nr:FHA domain-containing protein [Candidatus Acidoferrum sp.]
MAGSKIPLTFRIYKGEQFLREETLAQPVIKVGKLSSSHLRLDDDSVSRMHAVIEVSGPGSISIIDLGSTKGTVVNGQKVNKANLQDGDLIVLGDIRIELAIGDAGEDEAVTRVKLPAVPAAAPPPASASATPAPPPPAARLAPPAPPPAAVPPAPPRAAAPPPAAPPLRAAAPVAAVSAVSALAPPAFGLDSADDLGGARSIEVAAMLADSVVEVKHVSNPRGGKVSTGTYALFGLGAFLIAMSFFAFFVGLGTARENKRSFYQWTEVDKKPVNSWRPPERLDLTYDWMAFGGAIGGVLCIVFGLLRVRNERVSPYFRIGRAAGVDFPTDDVPMEAFPLVAPLGDDFVFNFTAQMQGEMMLDGQSIGLGDLTAQGRAKPSTTATGALEVPIPHRARFRVKTGQQTFLVSSVPAPRRYVTPLFATMETAVLAYFGGSLLAHLILLGLLWGMLPASTSLSDDGIDSAGRLSSVQSKPQEDPKTEEEKMDSGDDD